jgi:hypothetical protein
MAEQTPQTGKVPLKSFLADFTSGMADKDLREKYKLSAKGYVSLIKALVEKSIISQEDLAERREMAVQRDVAKETQFLSGLFLCPNCSHPHPEPFDVCPACGANVADFSQPQEPDHSVSTTGSHLILRESETEAPEAEPVPVDKGQEIRIEVEDDSGGESDEDLDKTSRLDSVRSFLSKLKKK